MRVICKKPGCYAEVIEVAGIWEINELVGNSEKSGDGINGASDFLPLSDIRGGVLRGVDQYNKEDAIINTDLEANLWDSRDSVIFHGTIVFAGYDNEKREDFGATSLTDEQISECMRYIRLKTVEGTSNNI